MSRAVALVVDGDAAHRESVAGFLRREGYDVLCSADGQDGWRLFEEKRPDIVVLDMLLTELSGIDLGERIAGNGEDADRVPVILMSDLTFQADWMVEPLQRAGVSAVLSKPVSREDLLAALPGLMPQGRPEEPIENTPGPAGAETAPDPALETAFEPPAETELEPASSPDPKPETEREQPPLTEAPPKTEPEGNNIVTFLAPGSRIEPPRLLLADDNPVTRQLVRRALEEQGYRVELAADGNEAGALLAAGNPDIVLLDINLPGRNGFEILDLVRRTPGLTGTAVVFLREPFEKVDEQRLAASPGDGLIQKPLKSSEWAEKVKDILDKKNRRASRS